MTNDQNVEDLNQVRIDYIQKRQWVRLFIFYWLVHGLKEDPFMDTKLVDLYGYFLQDFQKMTIELNWTSIPYIHTKDLFLIELQRVYKEGFFEQNTFKNVGVPHFFFQEGFTYIRGVKYDGTAIKKNISLGYYYEDVDSHITEYLRIQINLISKVLSDSRSPKELVNVQKQNIINMIQLIEGSKYQEENWNEVLLHLYNPPLLSKETSESIEDLIKFLKYIKIQNKGKEKS